MTEKEKIEKSIKDIETARKEFDSRFRKIATDNGITIPKNYEIGRMVNDVQKILLEALINEIGGSPIEWSIKQQ